MLVDPVTVAAASPTPALTLSVIKSDGYGSERVDVTSGSYRVLTQHSKTKGGGSRHYLQISQDTAYTDPFTGLVKKATASCSFTINRPVAGFTDAQIVALAKALTDYRDDSEVTTARLLQFQS
jgi:hypothetical protein